MEPMYILYPWNLCTYYIHGTYVHIISMEPMYILYPWNLCTYYILELPTETTTAPNEVALNYHKIRGLIFWQL